ncbi:histidine phosphatase family protein [Mycolicibacterium sp. CBMA 234]|uniref:histidine phosphatase family protein n=1 Tax=Mycolicibacterium sp. CBMA 234 TaxID=1918495 RepID=UPI0012DC3721|nr:histidine phosphatase family protein [Mycolicibacterium sp. CBMA 234]
MRRGLSPHRRLKRALQGLVVIVTATFMFAGSAFAAWAATNITITFVRHGESEGNVSCCIDSSIPGPNLTANGQAQAQARAQQLATDGVAYDGIYYSDMVRTQQTAAPFEALTGLPETELPGLHEVQAGIYEGMQQNSGFPRLLYALPALFWAMGNYAVPIPGSPDLTGANFESRFNGAVQTIYNSGNQNPVVFSHGLAIMAWTLMNVDNPDLTLMFGHPLNNTSVVTVNGNPTDGWTLVNWDGAAVSQNPALLTKLFVDTRKMITVPQMAVYNVIQAIGTRNVSTIATAIRDGVYDTVKAVVNYPVAVVKSVVQSIQTGTVLKAAPPPAPASEVAPNPPAASQNDKPVVTPLSAKPVSGTKPADLGVKDPVTKTRNAAKVDTKKVDDTKADDPKTANDPKADTPKAGDTPQPNTGDKGTDDKGTKLKKDQPKVEKPKKTDNQKKDKASANHGDAK